MPPRDEPPQMRRIERHAWLGMVLTAILGLLGVIVGLYLIVRYLLG